MSNSKTAPVGSRTASPAYTVRDRDNDLLLKEARNSLHRASLDFGALAEVLVEDFGTPLKEGTHNLAEPAIKMARRLSEDFSETKQS